MITCCVQCCNAEARPNDKSRRSVSYFKLPIYNQFRRKKWLRAIGRRDWDPPGIVHVCSDHFSLKQRKYGKIGWSLKDDAYPDMCLPTMCQKIEASDVSVCRFCLATDIKMFSLKRGLLKTCLDTIVGLHENHDADGLPQALCYLCTAYLLKTYNLMEKSMIAQATLLELYAENQQITKAMIAEQNRPKLNLVHSLQSHTSTPTSVFKYVYNEKQKKSVLVYDKVISTRNVNHKLISKVSHKSTSTTEEIKDNSVNDKIQTINKNIKQRMPEITTGQKLGESNESQTISKVKHLNELCKKLKEDIDASEHLLTDLYSAPLLKNRLQRREPYGSPKTQRHTINSTVFERKSNNLKTKPTNINRKFTGNGTIILDSSESEDEMINIKTTPHNPAILKGNMVTIDEQNEKAIQSSYQAHKKNFEFVNVPDRSVTEQPRPRRHAAIRALSKMGHVDTNSKETSTASMLECPMCDSVFDDDSELKSHIRSVHQPPGNAVDENNSRAKSKLNDSKTKANDNSTPKKRIRFLDDDDVKRQHVKSPSPDSMISESYVRKRKIEDIEDQLKGNAVDENNSRAKIKLNDSKTKVNDNSTPKKRIRFLGDDDVKKQHVKSPSPDSMISESYVRKRKIEDIEDQLKVIQINKNKKINDNINCANRTVKCITFRGDDKDENQSVTPSQVSNKQNALKSIIKNSKDQLNGHQISNKSNRVVNLNKNVKIITLREGEKEEHQSVKQLQDNKIKANYGSSVKKKIIKREDECEFQKNISQLPERKTKVNVESNPKTQTTDSRGELKGSKSDLILQNSTKKVKDQTIISCKVYSGGANMYVDNQSKKEIGNHESDDDRIEGNQSIIQSEDSMTTVDGEFEMSGDNFDMAYDYNDNSEYEMDEDELDDFEELEYLEIDE